MMTNMSVDDPVSLVRKDREKDNSKDTEGDKQKGAQSAISSKNIAKKLLRLNMWFIMVGVLALATASIVTFIMGVIRFFLLILKDIHWHHFSVPHNFNAVICEILEINLIAVILFISAIGLYLLFWKDIRVPGWLAVNDVNQLKEKLVGIVITVMGVTFLEHILEWADPKGTLMFGVAIALVIITLVFYIKVMVSEGGEGGNSKHEHHGSGA
ncbi:MAG: YqhA family protein [bacterium]